MPTALWESSGGHLLLFGQNNVGISEITGEGCTSLCTSFAQGETWVKFCLPALRFLVGCTEGKNEKFLAIKIKIHQFFYFHDPVVDLKNAKRGRGLCPIAMCI